MITALQLLLWIVIAIPGLLFLLILAAVAYGACSLRCSIRVASLTPCPKCGTIVGKAAVLAAKEAFAKTVAEQKKQHSGIAFRVVAEWAVCCPRCGATFYFYPRGNMVEEHSRFAHSAA